MFSQIVSASARALLWNAGICFTKFGSGLNLRLIIFVWVNILNVPGFVDKLATRFARFLNAVRNSIFMDFFVSA